MNNYANNLRNFTAKPFAPLTNWPPNAFALDQQDYSCIYEKNGEVAFTYKSRFTKEGLFQLNRKANDLDIVEMY